ncbi:MULTISPECIES: hypothetical protein [Gammaproteobacteria]|jgi:hypothetical protein|nr:MULTISPECIES: hypothetical protein [Vibrio]
MDFDNAKALLGKVLKNVVLVFKVNPSFVIKGLIYLFEYFRD